MTVAETCSVASDSVGCSVTTTDKLRRLISPTLVPGTSGVVCDLTALSAAFDDSERSRQ